MTPTPCSAQAGSSASAGAWSKKVVSDLHTVHGAAAHQGECAVGLVVVDGDAEQADFPSCFSSAIVSSQSPRPSQSSLQTWNCRTSKWSRPLVRRLVSRLLRMCSPGNASAGSRPSGAGQTRFFGGTLVATRTSSPDRSRTARPTMRSLSP